MSRQYPANLACSSCGKSQREVRKLVAGPDVFICDECIELHGDIIGEEQAADAGVVRALDRRAVEPPRRIAERATALADEIESLVGK